LKLGLLINEVATEKPTYSSVALMRAARMRDHEVFVLTTADFVIEQGRVRAWARRAPAAGASAETFLAELGAARVARVSIDELDVLLLRNNPNDDLPHRPWAAQAGLVFGEAAQREGVLVLNDPQGLACALSKVYLERFPAEMRPASIVTRHAEDVRAFVEEHRAAVVKPINGSGGRAVFVLRADALDNLGSIVEAVGAHGYLMVQQYLPEAREGDVRLLVMNGRPLAKSGEIAAIRRVAAEGELRCNIAAGGHVKPVNGTERILALAELARPQLIEDGMFLVGLDVVGEKVTEINVFSPGGLVGAALLYGVDFASVVVEDLERKIAHAARGQFENRVVACL
jgi:glutathione synthase